MLKNFLAISIAAIVGANLRYLLSRIAARQFGPVFPYGTLFINVVGSFIVGFFVFMAKKGGLGGAGAKAFAASKAEATDDVPNARFTDVVGCDEAVEELSEVVSFLHDASHLKSRRLVARRDII